MRNPRRTAATASALMPDRARPRGVRGGVRRVGQGVSDGGARRSDPAPDFMPTPSPTFSGFSTTAAEDARAVEGVAAVSALRMTEARLDGDSIFLDGSTWSRSGRSRTWARCRVRSRR